MAQQQQNTPVDQVLELLTEQAADGLAQALRILLNAAMLFECDRHLNASAYEGTQTGATIQTALSRSDCAPV